MPDIIATNPVVVSEKKEITYDKWFLSQILIKSNPERSIASIRLNRSAKVDDKTVLLDDQGVSFSLDLWKEMENTPELASAMDAVLNAIIVYANKKKLL